jgi:hypothetical protein
MSELTQSAPVSSSAATKKQMLIELLGTYVRKVNVVLAAVALLLHLVQAAGVIYMCVVYTFRSS